MFFDFFRSNCLWKLFRFERFKSEVPRMENIEQHEVPATIAITNGTWLMDWYSVATQSFAVNYQMRFICVTWTCFSVGSLFTPSENSYSIIFFFQGNCEKQLIVSSVYTHKEIQIYCLKTILQFFFLIQFFLMLFVNGMWNSYAKWFSWNYIVNSTSFGIFIK